MIYLAPHQTNIPMENDISYTDKLELVSHMKTFLFNICRKHFAQILDSKGNRIPVYMSLGTIYSNIRSNFTCSR